MRAMLVLLVVLVLGLVVVACVSQEDLALARMRQADAEARLAASTVNVLREQSNVHVEALRTEADISKAEREFELQLARERLRLHREEIAAILVEGRALTAAVEDSRAAAENSYWILVLGVPLIGMNLGLLVLVVFLILRGSSK